MTYDPGQPLISLHVPKTAGMSFLETLRGWYGPQLHLHYRADDGAPPARVAPGPGDCVHGHFNRLRGIGALDYYPEARQFIVMLRDPFDRFVSLWRYLHFQRRHGVAVPALDDDPDFGAWLDRRAATPPEADPFSFLAQLPWPIDAIRPDAAFDDERFLAVGLTERFDDSLAMMARALGKSEPTAGVRVNTRDEAHRGGDAERTEDYETWRARHREAFPLEYVVHAAGVRRFDADLAQLTNR